MAHPVILRLPAVRARTALSRSSIYKFIEDGQFPKQVRLGSRAVGWLDGEIDEWIIGRVDSRQRARGGARQSVMNGGLGARAYTEHHTRRACDPTSDRTGKETGVLGCSVVPSTPVAQRRHDH